VTKEGWSWHWIDVYKAVSEGCPIDIDGMRKGMRDEDTFQQEFLCVFLKSAGAWIPLELVARCEDDGATVDWPVGYEPVGTLSAGIDVARDRDKTVMWIDERIGDIAWTRAVIRLHAMPFPEQIDLLSDYVRRCTRVAVDATGMGVGFFDSLNKMFPGKIMGINFAGVNDHGVRIKTDMAVTFKKRMEEVKDRIPRDPAIRQAFTSIKREPTLPV
jgi:phage FluMu gp28-like protein